MTRAVKTAYDRPGLHQSFAPNRVREATICVRFSRCYQLATKAQIIDVCSQAGEAHIKVIAVPREIPSTAIDLGGFHHLRESPIFFDGGA
ncbi:hypothetical protein [Terricaulis sp.]|uniref:hypothetical protein n=1 Tax=Terricaulis sp. TaxID=2768686 RepID=UPI002AC5B79B|nr:hypothetical protein [Terricaulis sp.]MDZ4689703.1 hypothetical protein [Terricaulis sp.]